MNCNSLSGILTQPLGSVLFASPGICPTWSDLSPELALVTYLQTVPSVYCAIGNRYYPYAVDRQNTLWPAVTYHRASTDHAHGLSGSAGFATADIELDVWSTSYSDCVRTAERIRQALDGYQGYWGALGIQAVLITGEDDSVERPGDGSGTWYYSRSLDYAVRFVESIPQRATPILGPYDVEFDFSFS